MIKTSDNHIRLTDTELNVLRRRAAKNGIAVNAVSTVSQLLEAIIDGLDETTVNDMLDFLASRDAPALPPDEY